MPAYGVPTLEKTFMRGIQANKHIGNEIIELCEVYVSKSWLKYEMTAWY